MKKAFDLSPEADAQWEGLYSSARVASEERNHQRAIELADLAWDLIPEPRYECSVGYITALRRIATRYHAELWTQGAEIAESAALGTPFERQVPVFWVRAGIGLLEAGQREEAWRAFDSAWSQGKEFGFRSEDPKYLRFYQAGA